MKYISFFCSLLISFGVIYALNHSFKTADRFLPPVGKFLNPFSGFWQNAEKTTGKSTFQIKSEYLTDEVKVIYDDRRVPHIFAGNQRDALFAQGYVVAMDRLWQMDFSTRAAAGRLSELSGQKMNNFDLNRRRIGMGWAAENAVEGWKNFKEDYALLSAYIEGVNHFIQQLDPKDYPVEFKLINYSPEPWNNLKSALFFKSMALTLCGWEEDLESTNMKNHLGQEMFDFLFPDSYNRQSPIIPESVKWEFESLNPESEGPLEIKDSPVYGQRILDDVPKNIGSNNWAVSGSKTSSGKPILCNDPHLMLSLPSIWYEIHMVTPEMNTYGVCLPSMPGVIIGFNEHIAWGATNVGHDIMDWVKIKWANEEKTKYFLDGKIKDVELRFDTIKVRGSGAIVDTVKYTVWGPVSFEDSKNGYGDLALRWLSHDKPDVPELSVFVKLNSAKSFDEYNLITSDYITPAQNFIFASKSGDIAIKVNGRFPLRPENGGKFVKDGSLSANNWTQFIPKEHNPIVKNPERQFVSSANQHSTAADYPYYYLGNFEAYRGRVLNEFLGQMHDIEPTDMQALQFNTLSLKAREVLPLMINLIEPVIQSKEETELLENLKNWDFHYRRDSEEATYFNEWFKSFYRFTWDEFYSLSDSMLVKFPDEWRLVQLLEEDINDLYFDDQSSPNIETAKDMALKSFRSAIEEIDAYKEENETAAWGDYRNFNINHLANIPAFSEMDLSLGGHGDVLNANSGSKWGPSWRMVVSLTEPVEAYGVYPGGQSGNPGSPFYKNGIAKWKEGEYFKLHYVSNPEELEHLKISELNLSKQ
jgi:penicillin amidase